MNCPACAGALESNGYCPRCAEEEATGVRSDAPPDRARSSPPAAPRSDSRPSSARRDALGLEPGAVVAGRYRVAALIGEGGMGRVYRADDLLLDQPVALKFLPDSLRSDPDRLARFYGEVRVAREISHPNVCRVHDVGEVDGHVFISMEYVDGDSLASLLRRAGRMSGERASEVARQICAGLAAAHDKGVLHRDLKPENVIVDGRGRARLADFGLAGFSGAIESSDIRSGTPAYMAPEQIEGREVTRASDIYALGLVLYEIFTGRRVFEGRTFAELRRQHVEETPTRPGALVSDLNPGVEEVVLKCLEKDPRERPPSALAVAASLPGGNALAELIASGQTPSAALLATIASGERVSPRLAAGATALVVAAFLIVPSSLKPERFLGGVPFEKPPSILAYDASEHARALGYPPGPAPVSGFDLDDDYFLRPTADKGAERDRVRAGWPPVLRYWRRDAPRPMESMALSGRMSLGNPPLTVAGMTRTLVDTRGRLVSFDAVPPGSPSTLPGRPAPSFEPRTLFQAAGLDVSRFRPVEPSWIPPVHTDARLAFAGSSAEWPELEVRLEIGAFEGRAVYFRTVFPWTKPERSGAFLMTERQQAALWIYIATFLLILGLASVFAWRHLAEGVGDLRGALRIGTFVALLDVAVWFLRWDGSALAFSAVTQILRAIGGGLLAGGLVFTFYMALEPYVRRRSPQMIAGWTRFVWGRFPDAKVGRELLIGMGAAGIVGLFIPVGIAAVSALGARPGSVGFPAVEFYEGTRATLALLVNAHLSAVFATLAISIAALAAARASGSRAITGIFVVLLLAVPNALQQQGVPLWASFLLAVMVQTVPVIAFLRGGMLSVFGFVVVAIPLLDLPLSPAWSHWTGNATAIAAAVAFSWLGFALRAAGAFRREPAS